MIRVESLANIKQLLLNKGRKIASALFFPAYLVGAHWYDVLCAYISMEFNYLTALTLMAAFLFAVSCLMVGGHTWAARRYGWDITGLDEFKSSKTSLPLPRWRIFKRLKLFATKTRKMTFWLGSIIVGPPVVAILLRKDTGWGQNLKYVISSTLLSAGFWVSFYAGLGALVWQQFLKPFFHYLSLIICEG